MNKHYIYYEITTGKILETVFCNENDIENPAQGLGRIEGECRNPFEQKVENGKVVDLPEEKKNEQRKARKAAIEQRKAAMQPLVQAVKNKHPEVHALLTELGII